MLPGGPGDAVGDEAGDGAADGGGGPGDGVVLLLLRPPFPCFPPFPWDGCFDGVGDGLDDGVQ